MKRLKTGDNCTRDYRIAALLAALSALLVAPGCGGRKAQKAPPPATAVEIVKAERGSLVSTVDVTGTVRALEDVTLSAKMGGKVVAVPFREGDRVGRGAVVVQQQLSDLQQQARSAEADLASARSRLSQARTNAAMQARNADASVQAARALLKSGRENLAVVKQGARPQERRQAEAAVAAARANYENAESNLARTKKLYDEGAVARASLDADQRAFDVARSSLESAREALSLVQAGARPEEVRAAESNVRALEERLRQAEAEALRRDISTEEVKAARAAVQSSEATLAMARQAVSDAGVRTPVAGIVAERSVEPGEMVSPGVPLIRVYNPATVYFEATVSETQMGRIRLGQMAAIKSEAVPGRTFTGRVVKLYPAASTSNRSFKARLSVFDPRSELKPGVFAKGAIEVRRLQNVLTLPADAILTALEGDVVYVVERGTVKKPAAPAKGKGAKPAMVEVETSVARKRSVGTGLKSNGVVEVTSGVSEGDAVVRGGQSYLRDGQEVRVVSGGEAGTK